VLIQHPESVAIVALVDGELVTVRQPRAGASEPTLELPSGKLEPGETALEAAGRELAEECALAAAGWRELGTFWAVPAYSTELVHVVEAVGPLADTVGAPDEDEELEVERIPVEQALDLLSDAVSLAALALWRSRA
jgi:ADP-ribose pyrophosphatase